MRLVRFGERGSERPGVLLARDGSDHVIDVSALVDDYDVRFWRECGPRGLKSLMDTSVASLPEAAVGKVRLGIPVAQPGKVICVGQNYMDHVKEQNAPVPEVPVLFSKAVTALTGPYDHIEIPRDRNNVDWEVELAFVVGRRARRVARESARDVIGGFVLMNDVTERKVQRSEGQWHRGKSFDTFGPLGPWVITPDELGDEGDLQMWLDVNGQRMQSGSTSTMIFRIPEILEFITGGMTLEPGDVITTGTPPGVGAFRDPPVFLKAGDVVELGIDRLGAQRLTVTDEA